MKAKTENAAADASRRPGRVRGARKFGILSAMGLVAATALVGADCVVNSFVTVEGEGARAAADGSIHFANATGPVSVEVTARPGWKVEGRPSLSTVHFPGGSETLRVTSDLGEDSGGVSLEDCQFGSVVSNRHVAPPGIVAEAREARVLRLYALPLSNALVSASASCATLSNGVHELDTTWLPCGLCGATHDPTNETDAVAVEPGERFWTASFAGVSTNGSAWTGYMPKGTGQVVDFSVVATNECAQCVCQSETNAVVDVHELSVTNALFVGLDRTDGGRANPLANAKLATALIDPEPSGTVSYSWTDCGICTFTGRTDEVSAQYFAPDPDTASDSYLKEELKVEVAVTNDWGISDSAICKTNFTVVKVDVEIGGVGEKLEEKEGAFLPYVADKNGVMTVEGTNKMSSVSFSCEPELPPGEIVEVTCSGLAELYERLADGTLVRITTTNYPACEISSHVFKLHGHESSWDMGDGEIKITHANSGAVDKAKYTVYNIYLVTPKYDPVSRPKDSGDGQNEFTYSEASPGVLTMNLKAIVSPSGLAPRMKDDCMFSVGSIGNSTMSWDASNPGGAPTLDGNYLCATVTFTGLPARNADFGKKVAAISYKGVVFDKNDYEVFFPKSGKNHPECSTCPGCSNWFYYWREGDVCSIPKDAIWQKAEGDHAQDFGWHDNGTIYLTDLAAGVNSVPKTFTATFSIPTCEFAVVMKPDRWPDVTEKSKGLKGYAYSLENNITTPDPKEHTIDGIGGDGKGIGCVAQTAVHESCHKAYSQAKQEMMRQRSAKEQDVREKREEFGWESVEHASAEFDCALYVWFHDDADVDHVLGYEERTGESTGILSDVNDPDTYNFAQDYSAQSGYDKCGDEEIRARAAEPNAVYHVELDWANPGCQYSNRPYGPKR